LRHSTFWFFTYYYYYLFIYLELTRQYSHNHIPEQTLNIHLDGVTWDPYFK